MTATEASGRPTRRPGQECAGKYTIAVNRTSCRPSTVQNSTRIHFFFGGPSVMQRLHQPFRAPDCRNRGRPRHDVYPCPLSGRRCPASSQSGQSILDKAVKAGAESLVPEPGEVVRRISIDEAVKLAMEQNLGIRIQRFDPQIRTPGVSLALAIAVAGRTSRRAVSARTFQTRASTSVPGEPGRAP